MKKSVLFLILASITLSCVSMGCKTEAKADKEGAKIEVKPSP